jgi:hypothetical protein
LMATVDVAAVVSNKMERFLSCTSSKGGVECVYDTVWT